ncbi:helix-turn-helix domain-containing protein [Paenibacillus sp. CAU 1782]
MLLPFRLCPNQSGHRLPLSVYNCGLHEQTHQYRPEGYPALQCFINFEGYGTFHLPDGQERMFPPGHALLLPAGAPHEYSPALDQTWKLGFIGIGGASAENIVGNCNLPLFAILPLAASSMDGLREKLKGIWDKSDMDAEDTEEKLSAELYAFLLALSKAVLRHSGTIAPGTYSSAQRALKTAILYMKQHYSENLQIANIAHAVGYSVQHFQRIFREAYGMNPHAYLQRIRLQHAATWLENSPDIGIQEIASRLGMETSYFIRMFRKQYGLTPGKFRKAYGHRLHEPV